MGLLSASSVRHTIVLDLKPYPVLFFCDTDLVYLYYELYLWLKRPLSLSFKSWNWKSHTFAIGISQLTIIIWTVPFQNLMDDLRPKSRTYLIFPSLCLWHHLSLAHRQSRTYQQWWSFAIPCKKVKEKGKSLSWIRGIHWITYSLLQMFRQFCLFMM